MRRHVRLAPLVMVMAAAGCTGVSREAAPPASVPSATVAATPTVAAPAAVDGEPARRVYTAGTDRGRGTTVLSREPRKGQADEVRAACAATMDGRSLTFVVRDGQPGSSGPALLEGDAPETAVAWTPARSAGPVAVSLEGRHDDITSAYAVIVPAAE